MDKYLIDTNIVSGYMSASLSDPALDFLDAVIDAIPNISIITQIELLSWKTDRIIEKNIKNFIGDCNIISINPEVIEWSVNLRRNRKIKTPDAIIAATALANGYSIITNNEKDFANIKGLRVTNPFKI